MRPRPPHPSARQQPHRGGWTRKAAGRRPPHGGAARASGDGAVILYGWHTVKAALENPARSIRRLYATANAARRLAEDGVALALEPELVRPDAIAQRLGPDAVHNGLLAEAEPLPSPELEEIEPRASCSCSIRSPTRTMWARSCARRRPLRSTRS